MSVSKGTIIEKENTFVKKLYYLRDGYLRVFINNDGEEATTQIVGKQNFVTSFESFVTGKLAENNIKTVTDCEMLYITKSDYEYISTKILNWSAFCKIIYEKAINFNLQRTSDLITLTSEKRYLKLIENDADLIQKVPLQYIASYIGVKPESLSRIRKKIIY